MVSPADPELGRVLVRTGIPRGFTSPEGLIRDPEKWFGETDLK